MNSIENLEYSKKNNKGNSFINSKVKNEFLHKSVNVNSNIIKETTSKNINKLGNQGINNINISEDTFPEHSDLVYNDIDMNVNDFELYDNERINFSRNVDNFINRFNYYDYNNQEIEKNEIKLEDYQCDIDFINNACIKKDIQQISYDFNAHY